MIVSRPVEGVRKRYRCSVLTGRRLSAGRVVSQPCRRCAQLGSVRRRFPIGFSAVTERSMTRIPRRLVAGFALIACSALLGACSAKEDEPNLVAGKQLFVEKCGSCHVL